MWSLSHPSPAAIQRCILTARLTNSVRHDRASIMRGNCKHGYTDILMIKINLLQLLSHRRWTTKYFTKPPPGLKIKSRPLGARTFDFWKKCFFRHVVVYHATCVQLTMLSVTQHACSIMRYTSHIIWIYRTKVPVTKNISKLKPGFLCNVHLRCRSEHSSTLRKTESD
jgi:hypothetical protein